MIEPDTVLADLRTSPLTLNDALALIKKEKAASPGYDVFVDGDSMSILKRRVV